METIYLVVGASLSVILFVVGLYMTFFSSRTVILSRLDKATAVEDGTAGQNVEKADFKSDFLWVLGQIGRVIPRKNRFENIQSNLIKAQVFMRAEEFVGLTLLVGVAFYLVVFLLSDSVLLGLLGGLIGLYIPGMIINSKKRKRSLQMTEQLPEALNIISSGLRAGFSFPQAVSIVVREMEPPLAVEFSRVLRENRVGKPMDEALTDLLDRVENDDLELLVTALLIQRQVGGNLAEVLDSISHTIRERVRIKGEIRTLTAEGRISAIILSLLPIFIAGVIVLLNPDYILTLVQEPIGIILIAGAICMQVVGIFIIRKIVAIDV
ncbi:MAG: type II secretion system F family protein [Bacillota bacterium]|nr:type II secretion system F family protein [Bacillota bacterium]